MKTPEAGAHQLHPSIGNFLTMTRVSFCAIHAAPRQFHVSGSRTRANAEVSRARWLFSALSVAS